MTEQERKKAFENKGAMPKDALRKLMALMTWSVAYNMKKNGVKNAVCSRKGKH